ncbi:4-(cytidine 5'-diphospho)-2-C-methyl-D-erythritol kinase [Pseudotabrizicola alkalilacus]|uniref:4-diphosphocytidyl-2-C-methyl-D-erythritol kinase n=1 Tax=Pseudotabrizicola alkalilacus TaxID=2305252 RepID=A0A411Z508_9RHOB|nr:4-(cytidine 5'-diphospho)-2-C-methyl-D-erythritol kinase [Pseudotabrizicola alkalilacus]RGP38145.1 4-(cytidine 5'-diphospho)-2-C-methyl-D-erythritol kinase [Pseudotabrizicola alkalilacus]
MATDTVEDFAPAKINLSLHVTGQRADGYHLLDSLVVFADVGDRITVRADDRLSLQIAGPQAAELPVQDDNLVLRAARVMGMTAAITLDKQLPVASGIGGGSADAAATLRALARLGQKPLPADRDVLALGADVPVCLHGRAVRMQGVGEVLTPVPPLPEAWLVLVNPRVAVATPEVFQGMTYKANAPMPEVPRLPSVTALAAFLHAMRNDMEASALALAPVIGAVRLALRAQPGCLLARMSGSGATCFGVFGDGPTARTAAREITAAYPGWWVAPARMLS